MRFKKYLMFSGLTAFFTLALTMAGFFVKQITGDAIFFNVFLAAAISAYLAGRLVKAYKKNDRIK